MKFYFLSLYLQMSVWQRTSAFFGKGLLAFLQIVSRKQSCILASLGAFVCIHERKNDHWTEPKLAVRQCFLFGMLE